MPRSLVVTVWEPGERAIAWIISCRVCQEAFRDESHLWMIARGLASYRQGRDGRGSELVRRRHQHLREHQWQEGDLLELAGVDSLTSLHNAALFV